MQNGGFPGSLRNECHLLHGVQDNISKTHAGYLNLSESKQQNFNVSLKFFHIVFS